MNGRTYPYLELAALPAVGSLLLDPRPAFVFSADGRRILFANAAGVTFLGETDMGAALDRAFAAGSPLHHLFRKLRDASRPDRLPDEGLLQRSPRNLRSPAGQRVLYARQQKDPAKRTRVRLT